MPIVNESDPLKDLQAAIVNAIIAAGHISAETFGAEIRQEFGPLQKSTYTLKDPINYAQELDAVDVRKGITPKITNEEALIVEHIAKSLSVSKEEAEKLFLAWKKIGEEKRKIVEHEKSEFSEVKKREKESLALQEKILAIENLKKKREAETLQIYKEQAEAEKQAANKMGLSLEEFYELEIQRRKEIEKRLILQKKENEEKRKEYFNKRQEFIQHQKENRQENIQESLGSGLALNVFTGAAAAANAAALAMMGKYVSMVGLVEDSSARIHRNMQKWEQVQFRIGRMVAEQMVPDMEKSSNLALNIVSAVEKNPEIVSFGKVLLSGGTGIAGVLQFANQVKKFKDRVDMLEASSKIMGTPGAGGLAKAGSFLGTTGVMVSAVAIGAAIGKEVGNFLGKFLGIKNQSWGDILVTAGRIILIGARLFTKGAEWLARKLAEIFHADTSTLDANAKQIQEFFAKADSMLVDVGKKIDGIGESLTKVANPLEEIRDFAQQNIQMYKEYRESIKRADEEFRAAVTKAHQDYFIKTQEIANRAREASLNLVKNFNAQNIQAEKNYNAQRARIIENGNKNILRIEENLKKQLEALDKNYDKTKKHLIEERDAVGLLEAEEAYQEEKTNLRKSANEAISEQNKAIGEALQELTKSYEQEQAIRKENLDKQLLEIEESKKKELSLAEKENKEYLDSLEENYKKTQDAFQKALRDKINALNPYITGDYEKMQNELKSLEKDFINDLLEMRGLAGNAAVSYMNQLRNSFSGKSSPKGTQLPDTYFNSPSSETGRNSPNNRNRELGGYVSAGLWNLHDGEFVLSKDTTSALEKMAGGPLNQTNVKNIGGSQLTLNMNFQNGISKKEVFSLVEQNKQSIFSTLDSLFKRLAMD